MKAKKILLSGVAALSCAALVGLTACTTTSTATIAANWYKNSTLTTAISDTYEQLSYTVYYQQGSNDNYSVEYEPGSYTVTLENKTYNGQSVYLLTSELTISGTYTVGGETLDFTDSRTSEVYFRDVSSSLYPLYSYVSVQSALPRTDDPDSLADAVTEYNYTMEIEYSADDNSAHSVYTDRETNAVTECDYSLRDNMTVLDNETLLFAARGISLSVGSSVSVCVLNPYDQTQETIAVALNAQAERTYSFIDKDAGETEATEHTLTANTVLFGRSATLTGKTVTAHYASYTSDNTYRCVMLQMENPLPYNMGSLVYSLTEADFTDK